MYDHGISVGDAIQPMLVPCSDSTWRLMADTSGLELVTLTSVDDYCAECQRHLTGLDEVSRLSGLHGKSFLLTYAPPARQVDIIKAYHAKTGEPVCFDEAGTIWEKYDLQHTPVTLFLDRGRVVYAQDGPLDDRLLRRDVARAISRFKAR